ncbi:MAG TPA: lactate/malate dehydrogenase family protein [Thermoplasmata archaeon]|nr:lactate/malate dehydrogenase family protein [Thermoplasmata archaeon]
MAIRLKVGIVGVGKLGGEIAFAVARDGTWDDIVLYDVVGDLAWAQAEDIRSGIAERSDTVVRAGTLEDLADSQVVLLVAGQGRKPGMTRLDLLHANAPLVRDLSRQIVKVAPHATLVVLTNPVDVLTTIAWEASGLARDRVLGSGALLDSVRLRCILADRFKVRPSQVEAFVLGEHGERAVPLYSRVRIQGRSVELSPADKAAILEELRGLSTKIIQGKGGTAYGPAGATASLLHALVSPRPSTAPASVVLHGEYGVQDLALGVPAVVGKGHLLRVEEWPLPPEEQQALDAAAHDLGEFAQDASVLLGLAVRHTTLDRFGKPAAR